jgi:cyclopropane fatty-acyl-phospholipid synthase-like methyltransferase
VPKAIRQGQRKVVLAGVTAELQVGDVTDGKFFEGEYDLILDIGCYHVLSAEQRAAYRKNIEEHLAPSGTYLLYAFTSDDPENSRFTPKDLAALGTFLELERREDSFDPGGPSSAWLWYQRRSESE